MTEATKQFLRHAFRVYRKHSFAVNTALAASVAFSLASEYSREHFIYAQNIPQDPPSASLSDRSQHDTSERHIPPDMGVGSFIPPNSQGVDTSGFNFDDYNGIIAISYHVAEAVKLPAYPISDITSRQFNIPKYKITPETMDAVFKASEATGVPAGVLLAFASKESNFVTDAAAKTSSGKGLFQHVKKTWRSAIKNLGPQYGYKRYANQIGGEGRNTWFKTESAATEILGMRDNPKHAALMTAALLQDNKWRAESELGRELRTNEYYITHFLGISTAVELIQAYEKFPHVHVDKFESLKEPIEANRSVFVRNGRYRTVAEVMNWFDDEMMRRISYFTLKYDRGNHDRLQEALQFAAAEGILKPIDRRKTTVLASNSYEDAMGQGRFPAN